MKNFVQEGKVVTATAPSGGVTSGVIVVIGALAMIPATSAAEGELFEGVTEGVFNLPKTQADTPAQFAKAYLKSDGNITTVASGNTEVGVFMLADAVGLTNADIRLNGVGK